MGLDIALCWNGQSKQQLADIVSTGQFEGRVAALRSSYNQQGFFAWSNIRLAGHGFHWIFNFSRDAEKVVARTPEGTEIRGFCADWPMCLERAQAALAQAQTLPDQLTLVRFQKLPKSPAEYPSITEALDRYRLQESLRTKQAEMNWSKNPDHLTWALEQPHINAHGFFFGTKTPDIRGIIWCNTDLGIEPVLVVEGSENTDAGGIATLESTINFIRHGIERQAWIIWNE
jgi:hypothetical protein